MRVAVLACAAALAGNLGAEAIGRAVVSQNSQDTQAPEASPLPRKAPRAKRSPKHDPKARPPAPQQIAQNPELATRLQSLLPPGVDVEQAAEGFDSLEDFAAAVHASYNLAIPFVELKHARKRGKPPRLAQIIHKQNPNVDAQFEERRAMRAARQDLEELPPPEAPVAVGHR